MIFVARICSLLSLHPYFGTLLPCLKEMVGKFDTHQNLNISDCMQTKDFIKFLGLVSVLYLGMSMLDCLPKGRLISLEDSTRRLDF